MTVPAASLLIGLRRVASASLAVALTLALQARAEPAMPATDAEAHALAGRIVATADGATLEGPQALAEALARADVAILGETHDNAEHHAAQAWLVSQIAPSGLAFEMIPQSSESALATLRAQGADRAEMERALQWRARGWPDFAMYAPILDAAPRAAVTGGAVDRDAAGVAMREGAERAARRAIGAAGARYGLDAQLSAAQLEQATREQVAAHCDAIPESVAQRMVEAQRLRDAAFADAVLRARALGAVEADPDRPPRVALIAGSGHARKDRGAPAALRVARPDLSTLSLAMVEVVEETQDWRAYVEGPEGAPLYDFVWFTARAERDDPCAAFRAQRTP